MATSFSNNLRYFLIYMYKSPDLIYFFAIIIFVGKRFKVFLFLKNKKGKNDYI